MTSVSMNVTSEVKIEDKEIDLTPFCLESITMELESKKKTSVEVRFPRISLPGPKNKRQSDTNYSGVTYLRNLKITSDMIPVLKPKHLNINIRVDNNQVNEGDIISVTKRKLVDISVVLRNFHELDLEDMTLHINPYQKCYRSPEQMKELCLSSGIMNKGIKKLCPGETFEHSCGLLFLYDGQFMVDISCSANRKFSTPTPTRERAFALTENAPGSPVDKSFKDVWSIPLSPGSVSKKLKYHEADFWAQSFVITVVE